MSEFVTLRSGRRRLQWITMAFFPVILIGGWFWPVLGYFIPLCMVLGMVIAAFRGRQWCDWLCPRGAFFDVAMSRPGSRREIPPLFKGLPMRIGFMTLLMGMMTIQIVRLWPDPYKIGMFFVILLSSTTLLGVILALFLHPRTWCSICPIGSMGNWLGRWRHPLTIDSSRCTDCKACNKVCPIRVEPYLFRKTAEETVRDADCLKCGLCVAVCPSKVLVLGTARPRN